MTAPGWFLMHRGWMDTPALNRAREPYDRCSAWAYLIEHAAYQDTETSHGSHTVVVRRGQFSTSFRTLGEAWNWSTTRVRAFLDRMATDAHLKTEINTGRLLITLCDYDRFQRFNGQENTPENTSQNTQQTREQHASNTLNNEVTPLGLSKEENTGLTASSPAKPSEPSSTIHDDRQIDLVEVVTELPPVAPSRAVTVPRIGHDPAEAVALWNAMAAAYDLAQVKRLTDQRKRSVMARLRECGGIDGWRLALVEVTRSNFLLGREGGRGWKADFDFMLQESSFAKVVEGAYSKRGRQGPAPGAYQSVASAYGRARAVAEAEADLDDRFSTIDADPPPRGGRLLLDFGDNDGMTPYGGAPRDVH